MKYTVKYEDINGEVHCKEVQAYSRQDAVYRLRFVREIYWIKKSEA